MDRYLSDQANLRNLSMRRILTALVRFWRNAFCMPSHLPITAWLEQARGGEVVILRADETNKTRNH